MSYVEVIHESLNSSYMGQDLALKVLAKWILIFLIGASLSLLFLHYY